MILVLLCPPIYAQDEQSDSGKARNSLRPGVWALQFRIDDNFTLSSFQGALISLKHHRSAKSAFRLGVNLNLRAFEDDGWFVTTRNDTIISEGRADHYESTQSIQLDFQYVRYPNPNSRLNLFIGIGPLVSFGQHHRDAVSASRRRETKLTTWGVGASGQLGVEWFAITRISFHAEYGFEVEYLWTEAEGHFLDGDTRTVDNSEGQSISFRQRSLLFGLSAYF
jgi:hypothetical protein